MKNMFSHDSLIFSEMLRLSDFDNISEVGKNMLAKNIFEAQRIVKI